MLLNVFEVLRFYEGVVSIFCVLREKEAQKGGGRAEKACPSSQHRRCVSLECRD
jgi:hypothetical protein